MLLLCIYHNKCIHFAHINPWVQETTLNSKTKPFMWRLQFYIICAASSPNKTGGGSPRWRGAASSSWSCGQSTGAGGVCPPLHLVSNATRVTVALHWYISHTPLVGVLLWRDSWKCWIWEFKVVTWSSFWSQSFFFPDLCKGWVIEEVDSTHRWSWSLLKFRGSEASSL